MSRTTILKSKIHNAVTTETNLEYEGSITIDRELMDRASLFPYELVHVLNISNGARFETYVIEGNYGSKSICINGPAARLVQKGDLLIVLSYSIVDDAELKGWKPTIIRLDSNNNIVE
jgi:aspartate 1-decarboxylase